MTIWSRDEQPGSRRRRIALWALCAVLPIMTLAYQVAGKQAAHDLSKTAFGLAWFTALAHNPWAQALVVCESISFVAWMIVLGEMKLSAAFPLSAICYVLVVGASWIVFREPIDGLQILGGAAILLGVRMIGADDPGEEGET